MQKPKQKRRRKTSPLSGLLPPSVNKALRRFGFAQTSIVSNWPKIVGADMAAHTNPTKLTFKKGTRENGTLHIMVGGAKALELQHLLLLIIEKINMFHGFKLVGHIAITQGPLAPQNDDKTKAAYKELPVLEKEAQANLDQLLENTQSEPLKEALGKLGKRVLGEKS
jgi:hypothetical protein